jgi:hypothetical protein
MQLNHGSQDGKKQKVAPWMRSPTRANLVLHAISRCPYHESDPDVLMVESTEHRPPFDTPVAENGPSIGCILP